MPAKPAKSATAKPSKASKTALSSSKRVEKSVQVLADSDDSDDIDAADMAPRKVTVDSSDDNDDSTSDDSGSDSEEDVAPQLKKTHKKSGKYAPYVPPQGMTEVDWSSVKPTIAASPFEWNALAAKPGVQLWAMRVPRNFKPEHLAQLQSTSDSVKSSTGVLGTVKTSKMSYQLRVASTHTSRPNDGAHIPNIEQHPAAQPSLADSMLLPNEMSSKMDVDGIGKGPREQGDTNTSKEAAVKEELGVADLTVAGGEEMEGLRLVVPDVRRNGLYMAPKKITKHLILAPLPPQLGPTNESNVTSIGGTPSKRPQPLEKLKYRNLPFGAVNKDTKTIVDEVDPQRQTKRKADMMEVDEVAPAAAAVSAPMEAKKEKKKSRKSEVAGELAESRSERREKKSSRKSKT
ncbi:hypothetical protein QFC22_001372 [Naganishia vaughanmartiniae]|uniref:Uncharacterized protein n=1 Tax=Naganishia vaughanmartiniae TaxID=1424756 RepID=A0ACC2XIF5_9TREE|nr:hypothetical protein QFC22_001372 [Naganishia vaughanmartiniae]